MEQPSTSTLIGVHAGQPSAGSMRLQGRWLLLARMLWIAIFISTLLYFCANLLLDSYGVVTAILLVAATSVWFAVSFVLFWRKSNDRVILLFSLALVLVGGIMVPPYPAPLYVGISWIGEISLDVLEFLAQAVILIFYLFPDGRFVPHWTRWLALGWIVVSLDGNLPSFLSAFNAWSSPFSLSIYKLVEVAFYGSLVFAQLYRYRHVSSPVQRQQTRWVVFACAIVLVGVSAALLELNVFPYYFPALALPGQVAQLLSLLATSLLPVLIPLSMGIALLRYRLWDIDLIINRTLVYGVLTVSIVALYIMVVVGLGALLQTQGNFGLSLLATGLVAVLFQPLRTRLQRTVNRLMYGDRDDPYHVISRLGQHLEATLAPEAVLPTIGETVALALKLPYVAMTLKQEKEFVIVASYGTLRGEVIRLPLVYHTEQVGELVLAPRAPGEPFSAADHRLLEDLARQAGMAAHAVRLTAALKQLTVDLQRSREHLVTAREEERRRLRRDLHDGLGPQLASLTLKLETARNRLAHDPLAETLLSDLTERTQATVADIRRLVYALRPPALDELGLLSALRELTLQYGDQVSLHLDAPACLPELPAALEVAVYRIAQEALTNVVRHAAARHCDLRLALDERTGWLCLCIQDDGCGLPPSRGVGVGLVSMRERAEELGGTWTIEPLTRGGTCVFARLPYARTETPDALVVTPTVVPQQEE
jgi:signal transduction histidine kinase